MTLGIIFVIIIIPILTPPTKFISRVVLPIFVFPCAAIQDNFNLVSSAIEDIRGQQKLILNSLWHVEYSVKLSLPGIHTTPTYTPGLEIVLNP